MATMLRQTTRIAKIVKNNLEMFEEFNDFAQLIANDFEELNDVFSTKQRFISQGSKSPVDQIYQGISSYQFAKQRGGMDDYYRRKYLKYKKKYMMLKK